MARDTGIEWAHHSFNPWTGCTKVSAACDNCYAESWAKRSGHVQWGPKAARRRTKTWGLPVKLHMALEGTGRRERIFCASLADVFDNHRSIEPEWRDDLWRLITRCHNLDWLLLTKRPQNAHKMVPTDWLTRGFPDHVWVGTTVENQTEADRRIPPLIALSARTRFLSCEPLLGTINLQPWIRGLQWVITGGESGPGFRHADPDHFRGLRDQCAAAGVPFLFKQWEGTTQPIIKAKGRLLDGVQHDGYPHAA